MSGKRLKFLKLKYVEVLPLAKPDAVFVNDQQFHFRVTVLYDAKTERAFSTLCCELQTYATGSLKITHRLPSVYLSRVLQIILRVDDPTHTH
jgi:hypothetical protein